MLQVNSTALVSAVLVELVALAQELMREESLTLEQALERAGREFPSLEQFAFSWDERVPVHRHN